METTMNSTTPDTLSSPKKKKKRAKQVEESAVDTPEPGGLRRLPPLGQTPPVPPVTPLPPTEYAVDQVLPPKRKKKAKTAAGSQEALVEGGEPTPRLSTADGGAAPKAKRKRTRNRNTNAEGGRDEGGGNIGLATELYDLNDDVIVKEGGDVGGTGGLSTTAPPPGTTGVTIAMMKSEPTDKLFIEQRSGFKVTDKSKVAQRRAEEENRRAALASQSALAGQQSTTQLALWSQMGLQKIYGFMRGMLAGISLWQIISTYMLLNQGSVAFLSGYYMLAIPVQCLYFFLFAVCTVSVLDRYDLARPTYSCMLQSVTCQAGTVAVLFYFIGLVFSVSTGFLDERIGLYAADPGLWNNSAGYTSTDLALYQWSVLNVIRGVMAILGFLTICFSRPADRLRETLQLADKTLLALNDDDDEETGRIGQQPPPPTTAGRESRPGGVTAGWTSRAGGMSAA